MQKAKLSDRLLGLLALGAAILCVVGAMLDLKASAADHPDALLPIRLAVLLGLGVVSLFAAWWLWTGRASQRMRDESAAPVFGRAAGALPARGSRLPPLLAIVAVIALLAVAADRFAFPPSVQDPGAGSEIAEAPATARAAAGRQRTVRASGRRRTRAAGGSGSATGRSRAATRAGRPAAGPRCAAAGSGRDAASRATSYAGSRRTGAARGRARAARGSARNRGAAACSRP